MKSNHHCVPVVLVLAACTGNPEPEAVPTAPMTAAVVTAPSTPPPAAAGALDPVGNWDLVIEVMGQTQPVAMSITKATDGKIGGAVIGPDGQALPFSSTTLDGRKLTAGAQVPNGPTLTFVFEFTTNDALTGTIDVGGMGQGKLTGTRKKS